MILGIDPGGWWYVRHPSGNYDAAYSAYVFFAKDQIIFEGKSFLLPSQREELDAYVIEACLQTEGKKFGTDRIPPSDYRSVVKPLDWKP